MLPILKDQNQTISTTLLHEIINAARVEFGEPEVQSNHFMSRVEDELGDELGNVMVLQNPAGGRPRKYYELTLEQATLVGMRESKGVRRAVLAKLKELMQPKAPALPPSSLDRAVSDLRQWQSAADIFGVPESVVLAEGVKYVGKTHGIDFRPLLLASPKMDNIPDEHVMLEPTEIGRITGYRARKINSMLAAAGLQCKVNGQWVLTEAATGYASRHHWTADNSTKSGYNWRWNVEFVRRRLGI